MKKYNCKNVYNTSTKLMTSIIITAILFLVLSSSGITKRIFNSAKDGITEQFLNSETAHTLNNLNETAINSLSTIDQITNGNNTEEVKKMANQAVDMYNEKMDQIANGTYDAKAEITNVTNTGINAAKEINETANVVSDEDINKAKEELSNIATDKINQLQNGEFNATEEISNLTKQGKESLDTINNAGKESIDSINENTKDLQENKEVKEVINQVKNNETIKNFVVEIKDAVLNIF